MLMKGKTGSPVQSVKRDESNPLRLQSMDSFKSDIIAEEDSGFSKDRNQNDEKKSRYERRFIIGSGHELRSSSIQSIRSNRSTAKNKKSKRKCDPIINKPRVMFNNDSSSSNSSARSDEKSPKSAKLNLNINLKDSSQFDSKVPKGLSKFAKTKLGKRKYPKQGYGNIRGKFKSKNDEIPSREEVNIELFNEVKI